MIKTKAKIIFFAESEPKTEPDADCHDDPKTGVLFNKIFDLYLHCVIFLSDCPKLKEENGGCTWSEWRDMCKKTCGLCGRTGLYFHISNKGHRHHSPLNAKRGA